jgi:hypothetical protein
MNESRFTFDSMSECIAELDKAAGRSSLHGAKYARLAQSMRNAQRRADQAGALYIYFRFPSHRLAREYRAYTVG